MATLNIILPDPMKEFVDRAIGSGRFKDESAFMQFLIADAMETPENEFSEEQRERIDQMLLQSTASFDRGDYAPLRPGEFEDVVKRVIEQGRGQQAAKA
jgi:Arc/MetJ-type ribon-helix-helix transcriptional regulator